MSHEFTSVALAADHDASVFDCGIAELNSWLASHALRAQRAGTARTIVWVKPDQKTRIWAYFSLAPTEIARAGLSRDSAGGYSTIPGYLLARLAIDRSLHGHGYGAELLLDALSRAARAAETGGGRLVVVDAINDNAAAFYRHFGFKPLTGNPHRLIIKIATIQALTNPPPREH